MHFYSGPPMHILSGVDTRAAKVEADLKARVAREIAKAVKAATQVAEAKLKLFRAGQDAVVAARVAAEREKAAKQVTQAINAERLQHSGEKLRLETALADLTRRLQRRTAGDLGDEGEVNLYEMLKAEFPGDDISRVAKGVQWPDIIHRTPCGSGIIFDS